MARIFLDLTDEETEALLRQVAQDDAGTFCNTYMSQNAISLQTKVEQAVNAEFKKHIVIGIIGKPKE